MSCAVFSYNRYMLHTELVLTVYTDVMIFVIQFTTNNMLNNIVHKHILHVAARVAMLNNISYCKSAYACRSCTNVDKHDNL